MSKVYNATRKTCKRNHRIEIKLSDEELSAVKKKSAAAGLKKATYIRQMSVFGELKFYDLKEMYQIKKAFRMIGTELNQIAKVANSTNSVTEKDVADMKKQMDLLEKILKNHLDEIKPKVL